MKLAIFVAFILLITYASAVTGFLGAPLLGSPFLGTGYLGGVYPWGGFYGPNIYGYSTGYRYAWGTPGIGFGYRWRSPILGGLWW